MNQPIEAQLKLCRELEEKYKNKEIKLIGLLSAYETLYGYVTLEINILVAKYEIKSGES